MKNYIDGLMAVPEIRAMLSKAALALVIILALLLTTGGVIGYAIGSGHSAITPALPNGCTQSGYVSTITTNGHLITYQFACP